MQRPKEFDARVMAYLPALKKLAHKLMNTSEEREDLVQDTLAFAFDKWRNFRNDPTQPKSGFYNWLQLNMRSIAQMKRNKEATLARRMPLKDDPEGRLASKLTCAPRQEEITYANQIVRRLARTRDGRMLVRIGGGELLRDVAVKRGIGTERVRQLTERARERLVATTQVAA